MVYGQLSRVSRLEEKPSSISTFLQGGMDNGGTGIVRFGATVKVLLLPNTGGRAVIKILAFALIGISSVASAADVVSIPRITPYADGVGTDEVRTKCDWNSKLSEEIAHYAETPVSITDKDVSQLGGKVLVMKIVHVHAIGGGGLTGPKWAIVQGELRDNGKLIGSFEANQHSSAGLTMCGSLDHLAKELGDDIADWLKDPTMNAKP
jgi:hypothetical protein